MVLFRKKKPSEIEIPNVCGVEDTFVEELTPLTKQILSSGRKRAHCPTMKSEKVNDIDRYNAHLHPITWVTGNDPFNLISSLTDLNDTHLPVIDIDVPIMAVPSSTPGHFHLYIEKEMNWAHYRAIIRALMDAGVVEEGWYEATTASGAGYVRPPHLKKAHYYDLLLEGLNEMAKEA